MSVRTARVLLAVVLAAPVTGRAGDPTSAGGAAPAAPASAAAPASTPSSAGAPARAPAAARPGAPASAAPDPLNEAKRLYAEGVALFKAGRFRDASERFQAAYNLDPSPNLLYNLARSAEEMGDAPTAIGHYRAYLARYPQAEDRAAVEKSIRILEAVRGRPGRLVLGGVPPGARVTFGGAAPPAADADGGYTLAPAKYAVAVESEGREPWSQEIEVRPSETARVEYVAAAVEAGGLTDRPLRLWGIVAAGTGLALAGGAVWFGLKAGESEDTFQRLEGRIADGELDAGTVADKDQAQEDARDQALVANVLWGVAGAALAAGATMLVLDLTDEGPTTAYVVPLPGGVGLTGSF